MHVHGGQGIRILQRRALQTVCAKLAGKSLEHSTRLSAFGATSASWGHVICHAIRAFGATGHSDAQIESLLPARKNRAASCARESDPTHNRECVSPLSASESVNSRTITALVSEGSQGVKTAVQFSESNPVRATRKFRSWP